MLPFEAYQKIQESKQAAVAKQRHKSELSAEVLLKMGGGKQNKEYQLYQETMIKKSD
jgi:hypothetical protein